MRFSSSRLPMKKTFFRRKRQRHIFAGSSFCQEIKRNNREPATGYAGLSTLLNEEPAVSLSNAIFGHEPTNSGEDPYLYIVILSIQTADVS